MYGCACVCVVCRPCKCRGLLHGALNRTAVAPLSYCGGPTDNRTQSIRTESPTDIHIRCARVADACVCVCVCVCVCTCMSVRAHVPLAEGIINQRKEREGRARGQHPVLCFDHIKQRPWRVAMVSQGWWGCCQSPFQAHVSGKWGWKGREQGRWLRK